MAVSTVLVTGAAGFIGPSVVAHFLEEGHRVVVLDKLTSVARQENGRPISLDMAVQALGGDAPSRFVFHQGDVADQGTLNALFEQETIGHVVHMAAETHVDRAINGSTDCVRSQVLGTATLLEEIRRRPSIRTVVVSTDEVYGSIDRHADREGRRWWGLTDEEVRGLIDEHEFKETTHLSPGNAYAACKAGADLLTMAYFNTHKGTLTEAGSGMPVLTTRATNNYGPFQHPEKLIPLAICTLLEPDVNGITRRIPIYDRGLAVREWMSTDDHAQAIAKVMNDGELGHVYNLGSGRRCRNRDLLLAVFRACRRHTKFKELADASVNGTEVRPGHDLCYAANTDKLRDLGWQPRSSVFEQDIQAVVEWYVENDDWWRPLWTSPDFTNYWAGKYGRLDGQSPFGGWYTPEQADQSLDDALL